MSTVLNKSYQVNKSSKAKAVCEQPTTMQFCKNYAIFSRNINLTPKNPCLISEQKDFAQSPLLR